MTAPDAPRSCSECAHTPKQACDAAMRYCKRHKIAVKATANPCAFAKSRTVPKPDQGQLL